ncbi:hypothetical protein GUJ93_ZPchr0002g23546 [Zizania palustris]|nr:hypothetical protein GUJ93_ZPchr0002g23546 [Zizania palustris]KAG8058952.1 hypothetical protein GUJ93_ZPchr0002g23546 [Zizania palustris]
MDVVGGNAGSLQSMKREEMQAAVRKQLRGAEISPSSYDTAWVAMVPRRGSPQAPCFPQCVDWILANQQHDGSWGVNPSASSVSKEILLSTLACVLALARWDAGRDHVRRGLDFIGRNFSVAMDGQSAAPVGFSITFSGMLSLATGMGLELPVMQTDIDGILHLRRIELERDGSGTASARKAFMAFVSEGLGSLQDWDQVMAYQRKNGSLFNSPSTTAAAAIHTFDHRALSYLDSLASKFDGPVPAMHPQDVYSRLCMVDTLEKTGISQNFAYEIRDILDMTYRCWMQNEEEVMMDMATCSKAFRLLRVHGYDVASDGMVQFAEQSSFDDSIHGYLNDTKTLLELYRTSQVRFSKDDLILENIHSWSSKLLKQQLSSKKISASLIPEVEYTLKFPLQATLERLEHKRNIEQFKAEGSQLVKSEPIVHWISGSRADDEILALAVGEFSSSQCVYQQELQYLKSWVAQFRLDELKFARIMPLITLFSTAATMFPSELSDARIAWAQNSVLTTAVDDLFDGVGSMEELENFVALIEKWDKHGDIGFCSEKVEILFNAVYSTNKQIAANAALVQNRSVMDHIARVWLDAVRGMMREAEWATKKYAPATLEEYMLAAEDSFALAPIILSAAYLVGPELSEEMTGSEEYSQLLKHLNIAGRLLNDVQTYEREIKMGKVNSVMLQALLHCHDGGGSPSPASIEKATAEVRSVIQASRWELHRLVARDGGVVPRPCREVFWHMCKVVSIFYLEEDAYLTPKEMMSSANAVIFDPLQPTLPPSCP